MISDTIRPSSYSPGISKFPRDIKQIPESSIRWQSPPATEWSARWVVNLMVYRRGQVSDRQASYPPHACDADEAIGEAYRLTQDFLGMSPLVGRWNL